MANITLRGQKGSALTQAELDANFTNMNTELATKLTNTASPSFTGTVTLADVTGIQPQVLSYPSIRPSLMLDFVNSNRLDSRITFTRASTATRTNTSGVLETLAINTPRFDYDPTTGQCKGLLIEEPRTNSIRNNTMQGAVAGSPGTRPTNWGSSWTTLANGLQYSIAGVGLEDGISYVDINVQGTFTGTPGATSNTAGFEASNIIAGTVSQTWTLSSYITLVSGSLQNCELSFRLGEYDSGGLAVTSTTGSALSVLGGKLSQNRKVSTFTTIGATTATVSPILRFVYTAQQDYNFTLRIGLPQLELGAFATSVIPTTTATATRSADVAQITGSKFTPWYRQDEWTVCAEYTANVSGSSGLVTNSPGVIGFGHSSISTFNGYALRDAYNTSSRPLFVGRLNAPSTSISVTGAGYIVKDQLYKSAMFMNSSYLGGCVNNSSVVQVANAAYGLNQDTLHIGTQTIGGGSPFNFTGYIRKITYYPLRLADAEVQSLTL